jgi:menaquinone-dependent protoporphyrinogen oxidase
MRVLVTYGTKMGGTEGIARMLGETLEARGFDAEVRPANEVEDIAGYDAVIVGGALYMGRWHRHARHFIQRHARQLERKPVWLFSSGPLDDSATQWVIPPVAQVQRLMDWIGARGHMTFGGRLPADARGFIARAMAKTHSGDWRDGDQIRRWAVKIADELRPAYTGELHAY